MPLKNVGNAFVQKQERQDEKQFTEKSNARRYPPCPHCQRTKRTADMSWKNPNAANSPKNYKTENTDNSKDENHKPGTSTQTAPTSINKNLLH